MDDRNKRAPLYAERIDMWHAFPTHIPCPPHVKLRVMKNKLSSRLVMTGAGLYHEFETSTASSKKTPSAAADHTQTAADSTMRDVRPDNFAPGTTNLTAQVLLPDENKVIRSKRQILKRKHLRRGGFFANQHELFQTYSLSADGYADEPRPYSRKLAADFEDVMWTALTRKDPPIYANVDDYGVSKPAVVYETPPLSLRLELKNAKRFKPSSLSITTDLYADHFIRIPVELNFCLRVLSPWNSDYLNSGKDTYMRLGLDQHTGQLWGKFGIGEKEGVLIVEDTDSLYDWAIDSPAILKLEWRSRDVKTGEKKLGPQCMGSVDISANQGVKGVMFGLFDGWDAQFYTESVTGGQNQDWQAWATEWDAIAREEEVFIESY